MHILEIISQMAIVVFGLSSVFLVARGNRVGFLMGLSAQPFWYFTTILNGQWGIFFLSVGYTVSWVTGVYENYFKKPVTISSIILNRDGLYVGDLIHYYKLIVNSGGNFNPYHNLRHAQHVLWLCYDACVNYRKELTPRKIRSKLIAAMTHDIGHSGDNRPDFVQVDTAVKWITENIHPDDKAYLPEIVALMRGTEYPHKEGFVGLAYDILRDADLSQALNSTWIHQALGLGREKGWTPRETMERQVAFLNNLEFKTKWARKKFPRSLIESKVKEAKELAICLA